MVFKKPYKLYNLQYTSKTGEEVNPSRYAIKILEEVKVGDYLAYKGVLVQIVEIKGYLIKAVEVDVKFHSGRDWNV